MRSSLILLTIALGLAPLIPGCNIGDVSFPSDPLKTPFPKREKSTLLKGKQAEALISQCSRPVPGKIDATWLPTEEEISEMESGLNEIRKLKVEYSPDAAEELNLDESYMQYAGIVIGGRKLIYINAFRGMEPESWRESAVVICDGGPAFWGVLYDPAKKEFFDLNVNGSA